jgi:hypothetical protein
LSREIKHDLHLASDHVSDNRSAAAIRNMNHVYAGRHLVVGGIGGRTDVETRAAVLAKVDEPGLRVQQIRDGP